MSDRVSIVNPEDLQRPEERSVRDITPNEVYTGHEFDEALKERIAKALDKEGDLKKYEKELSEILKYARAKGATSPEDVMWEVRYLSNHLGTPGMGGDRVKHLYRYIYLDRSTREMEREMRDMEMKLENQEGEF